MLDQLRAMGVFACVVEKSSFSGAARELGITTSAVSQQVRSLENEMEVTLLYRSTRKLSLTEVGQAFFHSCQEMLAAAERGKIRINELRDDLVGDLRISATPEIGAAHVIPALSHWMSAHRGLKLQFETEYITSDLLDEKLDIAIQISSSSDDNPLLHETLLAKVDQVLVASPSYLNQTMPISKPEDLLNHNLIPINTSNHFQELSFQHGASKEVISLDMKHRIETNNVFIAKSLCQNGHGIARLLYLDVQKDLMNGTLVEVLPEWKLPVFTLSALTLKREQQHMKIQRCLDALKQYFGQLPGGRVYQEAS
ncbi:LysR family transcriptional regulator [Acinetobacter larvae]|uniref:LysR family transcriptional regulator n=1 Tax=Acinetobacter larvae TaxID=1789224 RepID=A0A1B2M1B7_9GAMM|nr:LysR family transcriptional regulator [Acinetobacter larvae]AOA58975.1 LysR family transcriptional regulator [Acinetobacter larvae]